MPTVAQYLGTIGAQSTDRHIITTTASAVAQGAVDVLLPDGTVSTALVPTTLAPDAGARVLLLLAACGNVVLATLS